MTKCTRAMVRALSDIDSRSKLQRHSNGWAESAYPQSAARCLDAGLVACQHDSETCKPGRRRYFKIYRLTAAGRAQVRRNAEGAKTDE